MNPFHFGRRDEGVELVEFALVSILFFTLVMGTLVFGQMIWRSNIVAGAAKDGARWAAVRGSAAPSSSQATSTSVQTYVLTRTYGMVPTVTTTWIPDNSPGSTVQVSVTASFTPWVRLLPSNTITLHSTAQMLIAR